MLVSFNYNKDTRFVVSEADKTVSPVYYVSQGNWLVDLSQQFETEEVQWMANEAVLKFPQNRWNRKVTHVFQQNTMIIKYPSDSNYHEIWINPLPCELVFKNFMPEFNSGSHKTKKMSTRWFLKFNVKFCHTHQSRGCLWDIIGHQILLNVITVKQGKANYKRQFRIIPNAEKLLLPLVLYNVTPKEKGSTMQKWLFFFFNLISTSLGSRSPQIRHPSERPMFRTPSLYLSLSTPPNGRDLSCVTFPQAPPISDKFAFYRKLQYLIIQIMWVASNKV